MGEEAPRPRSPPRYPDLCGRRRLQLEVQMLNREVGFLEQEMQGLERVQPVTRCCKDLNEFVGAKTDPLMPINKTKQGSCSLYRWIRSKVCTCFSCMCCCLPKPKMPCCCSCLNTPSCSESCCSGRCTCSLPSCDCNPRCRPQCGSCASGDCGGCANCSRCCSCPSCCSGSCAGAGCSAGFLGGLKRFLNCRCRRPSCVKCQSSCCDGEEPSCLGKGACCGSAAPSCPECSCGCTCSFPRCKGGCGCPPCGSKPCCGRGCLC